MSEVRNDRSNLGPVIKGLYAIIGISILILIGIAIKNIIAYFNRPTVLSLNVAPSTATISIDGKEYRNGSYQDLKEGTYEAIIEADGFESKTATFTVVARENTTYHLYLLNKENGLEYARETKNDIQVLKSIENDSLVNEFLKKYVKEETILEHMPILTNHYDTEHARLVQGQITDGSMHVACKREFCLETDQTSDNKELVEHYIKLAGYDAKNYQIIYKAGK